MPEDKDAVYRKFLMPVVDTCREFGVNAEYKPINDIIANGRKVSGNGAAEINDMIIIVGNFILDLNYEMMSKYLRVPDEKFRDKVFKTLQDNLSTMLRETVSMPDPRQLGDALVKRYESILGAMTLKTEPDADLLAKDEELQIECYINEWLFANDRRRPDARQVKICEGVYVIQNILKAPGGLIRVTAVNEDEILCDVYLSGDFFFYPAENLPELESALSGVSAQSEAITQAVEAFYASNSVETPGIQPADLARVLIPA